MLILVVSDLHLGRGRFFPNGQINLLEDFSHDESFAEFLDYFSSGKYEDVPVTLVLNGDILNLMQVDQYGLFSLIATEDKMVAALDCIAGGHTVFFKSLEKFLKKFHKKLVYVIGNHDIAVSWPGVQRRLSEIVDYPIEFCNEWNHAGVHIEHGHRFEVLNSVPYHKLFIDHPNGEKILNLPWGTQFCIHVLPQLKKHRPLIDKVRPMKAYVKWCLLYDTSFFFRMISPIVRFYLQTWWDGLGRNGWSIRQTLQLLQEITIYPKFEKHARKLFKRRKNLKVVIMGHSHLMEWRKYFGGKIYINTGTWNSIPSVDSAMYQNEIRLSYVAVDVDSSKNILSAGSYIWHGQWRPFREEVALAVGNTFTSSEPPFFHPLSSTNQDQ